MVFRRVNTCVKNNQKRKNCNKINEFIEFNSGIPKKNVIETHKKSDKLIFVGRNGEWATGVNGR